MDLAGLLRSPDLVRIETEAGYADALPSAGAWGAAGAEVRVAVERTGATVRLSAPGVAVRRVLLRWRCEPDPTALWLGDHWERAYGDLAWRHLVPERVLPWYVLCHLSGRTSAIGVATGCASLASWQVDARGISLWLDVRSGGVGVELGGRDLPAARIVAREGRDGESAFAAARAFCRLLCPRPRLPKHPVYGGNNWYYAYGECRAEDLVDDAARIADLSPGGANRPFMLLDDGWQAARGWAYSGGPWHAGNAAFPDMRRLADDMRARGTRPGLWYRPLLTDDMTPKSWRLDAPRPKGWVDHGFVLDPTVPGVGERLRADMRRFVGEWGYDLVKHDFTTYDLLGFWGSGLGGRIPADGWCFADRSRTSAEVVGDLYRLLREAAGEALIIGCNTIGHLAAGTTEIQRTGDDTSGLEWERTRRMGVNTLAFRMPQHDAFFAHDADCVGLTTRVPWELNRQWLELLAASGTPCFVSADPKALGADQGAAIKAAFARASVPQPAAEPLDWLHSTCPERWRLGDAEARFDWTGDAGTPAPTPE
jgi:alpha-galactosidase